MKINWKKVVNNFGAIMFVSAIIIFCSHIAGATNAIVTYWLNKKNCVELEKFETGKSETLYGDNITQKVYIDIGKGRAIYICDK